MLCWIRCMISVDWGREPRTERTLCPMIPGQRKNTCRLTDTCTCAGIKLRMNDLHWCSMFLCRDQIENERSALMFYVLCLLQSKENPSPLSVSCIVLVIWGFSIDPLTHSRCSLWMNSFLNCTSEVLELLFRGCCVRQLKHKSTFCECVCVSVCIHGWVCECVHRCVCVCVSVCRG